MTTFFVKRPLKVIRFGRNEFYVTDSGKMITKGLAPIGRVDTARIGVPYVNRFRVIFK